MQSFKLILTFLTIVCISFSCTDHDTPTKPCNYLGQSTFSQHKNYRYVEKNTYDSDYILNDAGLPLTLSSVRVRSTTDTITNETISSVSEEIKHAYA